MFRYIWNIEKLLKLYHIQYNSYSKGNDIGFTTQLINSWVNEKEHFTQTRTAIIDRYECIN